MKEVFRNVIYVLNGLFLLFYTCKTFQFPLTVMPWFLLILNAYIIPMACQGNSWLVCYRTYFYGWIVEQEKLIAFGSTMLESQRVWISGSRAIICSSLRQRDHTRCNRIILVWIYMLGNPTHFCLLRIRTQVLITT